MEEEIEQNAEEGEGAQDKKDERREDEKRERCNVRDEDKVWD